ncbi:MAG: SDR family oxidoreductase [Pseudomonadota bacterium]
MTHQPGAVLVTGAAQRIGRAIALDLAQAGWRVAVHYHHSSAAAEETVALIASAGGKAVSLKADLADEAAATGLVGTASARLGEPLIALVNNASIFARDQWNTASRQSWDSHLNINLRAPFLLIQALAVQLPKERTGAAVNILDQRVWKLTPDYLSYTLSKAGLWTLTRTLAQALAPRLRVNGVGPGPVLPSARQDADSFARQAAAVPLRHGAAPQEIADAVRFLLDSPSITGQMIAVDGGQHLAWQTPDVIGVE